nr:hypothetical protein CFP56_39212 [Quercus suber]
MEEEEGWWFRGRGERRKHKLIGLVDNKSIHDFLCLLCLGSRLAKLGVDDICGSGSGSEIGGDNGRGSVVGSSNDGA